MIKSFESQLKLYALVDPVQSMAYSRQGNYFKAKYKNHKWSLDFVHDALADGRKIRLLTRIMDKA